MPEKRDQPERTSQRAGRQSEEHEPAGDTKSVKEFAVVFPMDKAWVNGPFIDVTAKGFRDDATGDD